MALYVGSHDSDSLVTKGFPVALSANYVKDFQYLKEKSDHGTLNSKNAIYEKLDAKARNLPELRSALNTLKVKYV